MTTVKPSEVVVEAKDKGASMRVAFGHAIELRKTGPLSWCLTVTALRRADSDDWARYGGHDDYPFTTGHSPMAAYMLVGMILAEAGAPSEVISRATSEPPTDLSLSWSFAL